MYLITSLSQPFLSAVKHFHTCPDHVLLLATTVVTKDGNYDIRVDIYEAVIFLAVTNYLVLT